MSRQLTDDDAFVLASCMGNQLASEKAMISPHEIQILIEYLDQMPRLNPDENTAVFLARQDLFLGRYRAVATRICDLLLLRAHQLHASQNTSANKL